MPKAPFHGLTMLVKKLRSQRASESLRVCYQHLVYLGVKSLQFHSFHSAELPFAMFVHEFFQAELFLWLESPEIHQRSVLVGCGNSEQLFS